MSIKLSSIRIVEKVDEYSIPDWLGHYTDSDAGEFTIAREKIGNRGYKYFCAENVENKEQSLENYQLYEKFNDGGWCLLYVYAEAQVVIGGIIQKIRSGGLGGIESESDKIYLEEIAKDEIFQLKQVLLEIGVPQEEIDDVSH